MECMKSKVLDRSLYSADIWDYGKDFIEKRDPNDLKILRPGHDSDNVVMPPADI